MRQRLLQITKGISWAGQGRAGMGDDRLHVREDVKFGMRVGIELIA